MNKVSVIIPMYNSDESIRRLLNELSEQTYQNSEYIIVDDGSKDESYLIVKKYIEETHDNRFELYHQENKGVSSARNLGLQHASGEYLIFIDADDKIEKLFIEKYVNKIKSTKSDIAIFPINVISSLSSDKAESVINNCLVDENDITAKELLNKILAGYINTYLFGFIFKRSLWKNVLFDEGISYKEDYLSICTILFNNWNCKIVRDSNAYYWYCDNQSGLSGKYTEKRVMDGLTVSRKILNRIRLIQFPNYGLAVYSNLVSDLEAINFGINSNNKRIYIKYSKEYLKMLKYASFPNIKMKVKRILQGILLRAHVYKVVYKKMKSVKNENNI
ncbi:glycosyltransferase family 2 protein [Lactobacillus isalae]|uniref:glycosyltransferase family 2 protein n=1 Tax=Lactobacillus isalae TaxID=2993455 RepID=UPI0024A7AA32|nr:glycosyltransferase family 2 protein [Lactobacillus isalae]